MSINFSKYQGSGNDFIIIDNRDLLLKNHTIDISGLCDRSFGIGADGLIIIMQDKNLNFRMIYYNADGQEADMCGNGARCAVAYVHESGNQNKIYHFSSRKAVHSGEIISKTDKLCTLVKVSLTDPEIMQDNNEFMVINTGVPHYIQFTDNIELDDFVDKARKLRYDIRFQPQGVNVNFAKADEEHILLRTYERGVENETLSCGTSITATAIAAYKKGYLFPPMDVKARGGELKVYFNDINGKINNVFLEGPACKVFDGTFNI